MATAPISTAFVAGATGLVGREVVRALRARQVPTVAHVRPDSSRLEEWRETFSALGATLDTTAWDASAMRHTLTQLGPAWVFALLGTTRARGKSGQNGAIADTYDAVDLGLTRQLMAAARAAGDPRFVYLSAVGASPDRTPANPYMRVRCVVERELGASGLPAVVVRPAVIHGDRDDRRPLESVATVVGDGLLTGLRALGGRRISDRYRSITAPQLAEVMVRATLEATEPLEVIEGARLRRAR